MPEEAKPYQEGISELKKERKAQPSPIADSLEIEFEPVDPDGVPLGNEDFAIDPPKKASVSAEKTAPKPAKKEDSAEQSKIPAPGKVIEFAQAAILQKLGDIGEKIAALEKKIADKESVAKLEGKFDVKIAQDAHSKEMFSAMHTELKSYKDSALFDVFHKPFLKDLVLLFDDMGKLQKHGVKLAREAGEKVPALEEDFKHHANNIDNIKALVLEMLNRMDVEMIEDVAVTIDKQYHKVLNTRPAPAPDDDGKIAEIVHHGFRWRGKLLRHEEVIVYKQETT